MDDDFVDVFRGGVGDSPVKTSCALDHELGSTSSWRSGPPIALSIPGIETGGGAAAVPPAIPSHGIAMPSPAKESVFRSARTLSDLREDDGASQQHTAQQQLSPVPSPHPRFGMTPALTIDPGGDCVPTEMEKKRAKLERFRFVCSEVSESFLYVSGEDAAKQEGLVQRVGVTHIINCAGPQCPNYLEHTGCFSFLRLNFYDHRSEDIAWFIYRAFDFISAARAKRGRVLIHCVQGVSRSCTLAIAWLMLNANMDYDEAYVRVRQGRPICAPNTGFICSLLEWQRRREQPLCAPLLYRTAWHVPHFHTELVLKLCLHEEDRKHVKPSLQALDPRGCYVLVVPRLDEAQINSGAMGEFDGTGENYQGGTGTRIELEDEDSSSGGSPSGLSELGRSVSRAASGPYARNSAPTPRLVVAGLNHIHPAEAGNCATSTRYGAGAAGNGSAPTRVGGTSGASGAAAAAGEAAMAAKAMEVGVAIATALRDTAAVACCGRDTSKGRGGNARKSTSEARTAASVMPEEMIAADVAVYVWRGLESHARMLELAKEGARWLCEYEGWGDGVDAPVVEQGQEPQEMLRYLGAHTRGDAREPPIPGDLTAPSPAPTTTWPSLSVFGHPPFTPSGHPYMTPRAAPLLSPAEPPIPSPAGPSPSPGGGVSFSPYGHGVSPAGGIMSGSSIGEASGLRSYGNGSGSGILGVPAPTVSPAGSVVTSPATSKLYMMSDCTPLSRRCSLASATEEPEASGDDGYLLMGLSAMEREDEEDEPLGAPAPAVEMDVGEASGIGASSSLSSSSSSSPDVSAAVDEFIHEAHDDDGRGAERFDVNPGALTPSSKLPSTVPPGWLARVPTELPVSLQTGLPPSLPNEFPIALPPAPPAEYGCAHLEERRRAAPRLFELANEPLAGAQNGSGRESTCRLQWSELVIYDYEDLVPQCCFLLVIPGGKTFLWVGKAFMPAEPVQTQEANRLRRVKSLAREAARSYDTADDGFPGPDGVDSAVLVPGNQEPDEWWNAFESAYR